MDEVEARLKNECERSTHNYQRLKKSSSIIEELAKALLDDEEVLCELKNGEKLLVTQKRLAEYRLTWEEEFGNQIKWSKSLYRIKSREVLEKNDMKEPRIMLYGLFDILKDYAENFAYSFKELTRGVIAPLEGVKRPEEGFGEYITSVSLILAALEHKGQAAHSSWGKIQLPKHLADAMGLSTVLEIQDLRFRLLDLTEKRDNLRVRSRVLERYKKLLAAHTPVKAACQTLYIAQDTELLETKSLGLALRSYLEEKEGRIRDKIEY